MSGNQIVRCAIHSGIGVARVGNSPTEYVIGPEVPSHTPDPGGARYKDAQGRIKCQVARFRLYGLDASGTVVREITAADGLCRASRRAGSGCYQRFTSGVRDL